jgi:hypothetical protein
MSNNENNSNSTKPSVPSFLLPGMRGATDDASFFPDISWTKVGIGVAAAAAGGYAIYTLKQINDKLDTGNGKD